jgi:putative Ca2+/H+ antiporter (TMEM165/GDT1 family)
MHGIALFFSVFAVVFAAELPDKTALAALVLATRHRPASVLLGAASALTIQTAVAVAAGHLLSLLPQRPVHVAAGLLFLVSAVVMWRREEEAEEDVKDRDGAAGFWRSAWIVFVVVFVAEWGDLTQIATAGLAARYRAPLVVFAGAALALWSVAAIAVFVGHRAGKLLDAHVTKRVAAVLFAAVGGALVAGLI